MIFTKKNIRKLYMKWYEFNEALIVADFVVTDPISMKIIRELNIPVELDNRQINPDDAVWEEYNTDYFVQNWFAVNPQAEEIPEDEYEFCEKRAKMVRERVPINHIGKTCGGKAIMISLAFDIDRLGGLNKVIEDEKLNEYYQKEFCFEEEVIGDYIIMKDGTKLGVNT
jgi:hypothetical protein